MSPGPASGTEFEFAILGAGAIGSILGAHLARAGHSVVMLVRERRAADIRANGLRIKGLDEFRIPVAVSTDHARLSGCRVLIVAMKTAGTRAALGALCDAQVEMAFSIQNGIQKDELLAERFGAAHTLGALADTSGELLEDGTVLFTRNVNILLGELSGEVSTRVTRLAASIDAAGVRARAVGDIIGLEWSKFVAWAGLLVLSLTTRAVTWRYLVDRDAARVLIELAREIGKLATSRGIRLTDQSVLPTATLVEASDEAAMEAVMKVGAEFAARAPSHRMSCLQDLEAGRPLEIHETLGHALELAEASRVPTPLLAAFYRLVIAMERAR